MLEWCVFCGIEVLKDILCQDFTQLNAPLIEGVDIPDDALGEDFVLIECHEHTEGIGIQFVADNGIGRSIAFEGLLSSEGIADTGLFGLDLCGGLTKSQCFGLSNEVRQQLAMMIANWGLRTAETDEIGRNELGALMEQLEE